MEDKTYYCENCFKDGLTQDETITDNVGGIFCSKKCRTEFKINMKENRKVKL